MNSHTHKGSRHLRLLAAQVCQIFCFQTIRIDAVAIETMLQSQEQSVVVLGHVDMVTWKNAAKAERVSVQQGFMV